MLSGSARENSNTGKFTDFLLNDTEYESISLRTLLISPYNYTGIYDSFDQFGIIAKAILANDIIIFATPVYWYAMSGIMKNMFDRLTDLVTVNKTAGRNLKGKYICLIAVGTEQKLPEGFETPFKRTADYFDMNYVASAYACTKVNYDISVKNAFIRAINKVSL